MPSIYPRPRARRPQPRPRRHLRSLSRWVPIIGASLLLVPLFISGLLRERQTPIDEISHALGVPDHFATILFEIFPDDHCTSLPAAETNLRRRLDEAGYADWTIRLDSDLRRDGCIGWSFSPPKTLTLVSSFAPEVAGALTQVSAELMATCYDEQKAVERVTSVLSRLGVADFIVRTDGGLAVPLDNAEEVLRHVEAGCWVYSGTGWDEDGRPLFFVSSAKPAG